ncbi:hypothetical protein PUN28_013204 [Cardiocondyla obscurior]|uniref:Uncharacterized protein n=1 Tax=Cardiocondyla obscurior TaxID=286306 RepID=A0AAW2F774_9HYME
MSRMARLSAALQQCSADLPRWARTKEGALLPRIHREKSRRANDQLICARRRGFCESSR